MPFFAYFVSARRLSGWTQSAPSAVPARLGDAKNGISKQDIESWREREQATSWRERERA
jgi:hypothetical protein